MKERRKKQHKKNNHINEHGFVMMNRSDMVDELVARNKNAAALLMVIAKRAWRGPLRNRHNCAPGEAFIGDYATYNFTRMQYRVAVRCLKNFGLIEIRANKQGTIVKLISPEIFDINVDLTVTDRGSQQPSSSLQAAITEPSSSLQAAIKQPSGSHQGTTNNNVRREEGQKTRRKKDNTTNNAGANGGGAFPPSEGPVAGEEDQIPQAHEPEEDWTATQKAVYVSKILPEFLKIVCGLNQLPVFTKATMDAAIEWFEKDSKYEVFDLGAIIALGIVGARETSIPQEGLDPFFWSRRFCSKPNRLWTRTNDGDLIISRIELETKYALDAAHSAEWCRSIIDGEVKRAVELKRPAGK
jgi:hypothetical protein